MVLNNALKPYALVNSFVKKFLIKSTDTSRWG